MLRIKKIIAILFIDENTTLNTLNENICFSFNIYKNVNVFYDFNFIKYNLCNPNDKGLAEKLKILVENVMKSMNWLYRNTHIYCKLLSHIVGLLVKEIGLRVKCKETISND